MWSDGGPIDPSPTIDQAINGGYALTTCYTFTITTTTVAYKSTSIGQHAVFLPGVSTTYPATLSRIWESPQVLFRSNTNSLKRWWREHAGYSE